MKLSKNFTVEEFEKSQSALHYGIDNQMGIEETKSAIELCENVLQPARDHFGKPIHINSGFRSLDLNRTIGGASNSQHTKGEAADIELIGGDNWELLRYIIDNLSYDQLIAEYMVKGSKNAGWVHVSYKKDRNRLMRLTARRGGYVQGIDLS